MANMSVAEAIEFAVEHHRSGRTAEAAAIYREVLSLHPDHPVALHLLGVIAHAQGQSAAAVELIRQAVAIDPKWAEAQVNLGIALFAVGDPSASAAACLNAILLKPDYADAHFNLANALSGLGRGQDAVTAYKRAIALNPDFAPAYTNMGNACLQVGLTDVAIAMCREGVKRRADSHEALSSLGVALAHAHRFDEAIAVYRTALAFKPDYAEAHWNLANALLITGLFREGWNEFEWRLKIPARGLSRGFAQRQWDGSDTVGKTVLFHAEGGFGDALQFIRLVPLLRSRGGTFFLECQPSLVSLFQEMRFADRVIPRGSELPSFDYQVPLLSLPRVMGLDLSNIPGDVPYIIPHVNRVERWKERLKDISGLKIGLVWAGSVHQGTEFRSRSVNVFEPLLAVGGVRFFNLQVGPDATQKPPNGMELIDFTPDLIDFADTAALIQHLDLVISVDTSVAHLAGALAMPVWVLIPAQNDFRWLLDRRDTPWYPTMRLFRQRLGGDWQAPIAEMVGALRAFKGERT